MKHGYMKHLSRLILASILFISLLSSTMAYATPEEGDQNDLSAEEIASAIANGDVAAEEPEEWSANSGISTYASSQKALTTIGGATRYETSAAEALHSFSHADTVIVTGGETYADSIAGSSLAGALDAPILLVNPSSLTSVSSDAIRTLGPSRIIILGGTDVVSTNTENQLKQLASEVIRLQGATRYETQMEIYNYGVTNGYWTGDTAIVATGEDFADALSISPIAYQLKAPIFFANNSDALPAAQLKALQSSGKTKILIVGGTNVVSSNAENQLKKSGTVTRLGGALRYDTSRIINDYAVANYGFTWEGVAFASGEKAPDSLGGGAMQGKQKHLLALLDDNGPKAQVNVPVSGKPSSMIFLGGKDVYSNAFKAQVAFAKGYKLTDIEGFKVYIDAGHGQDSSGIGWGWDPGATAGGYVEANQTQQLADKVANVLRNQYGLDVYVNKSGYYKLRQTQASMLDCGVLVSIHFNAGGGTGTESYIHSQNAAWGSTTLQNSVHSNLVSSLGLRDRGKGRMQLAVVSGKLPAVLLEICFIDKSSDMQTYTSKIDNVAAGIAKGIANA